MPGPPFGPSYLITTTSPLLTLDSAIAVKHSNSLSNTLAGPENFNPSLPVIFATHPSSARFPFRICIWPDSLIGLLRGKIISLDFRSGDLIFERFSSRVLPVTVIQSPLSMLFSSIYLRTDGTPPIL